MMTAPDRPDDRPDDRPLTIAAAAAALGITYEAVRSRIRRGVLRGERTPNGWRVWLGDDRATGRSDRPLDRPEPAGDDRLRELVEQLRGEVVYLRGRLDAADEGQAELRRLLLLEQQNVASLRALLPSPQEGAETAAAASAMSDTPPHPQRPWWAPWRR